VTVYANKKDTSISTGLNGGKGGKILMLKKSASVTDESEAFILIKE
jgi:hypothetical protein